MNDTRPTSDHPTDRLIRELIQTGKPAKQDEIRQIVHRLAVAPFNPRAVLAHPNEQGLNYRGRTLEYRDDSLFVHLVRRVIVDEQWAFGTTEAEYLDDLRRAILFPNARLAIYRRRGGAMAATWTRTDAAVPTFRLGIKSNAQLWVVYSADHGIIVSGYQAASLDDINIPEDTRWLL